MEQKIVFTGPVGAGKTTAIGAISDIAVVKTEATATDETARRKPNTTVAMDYGALHLADGVTVHLYGTPGQERFNFMWDILTVGAIGLVIMVDAARPQPLADLALYVEAFQDFITRSNGAVVIGLTRCDAGANVTLEALRATLLQCKLNVPVFEVDARSREDVRRLLLALLAMLQANSRAAA